MLQREDLKIWRLFKFFDMKKLEYFRNIRQTLLESNYNSLSLSMNHVHHKGLFSLVIGGEEFGSLIRVFIANKEIKPYGIQLHSHRYPIYLTCIKGNVRHYTATQSFENSCDSVSISRFRYKSPITGGNGLSYEKEIDVCINDYALPIGGSILMSENEIHTVSCSKGSVWIVEEKGFVNEDSVVLGVPFTTENLYKKPKSNKINDNYLLVKDIIENLINTYSKV